METLFLTHDEVAELTGRRRKSLQIAQLRRMCVIFRVNACGQPVIARSAIEYGHSIEIGPENWQSDVAKRPRLA